MSRVWYVLVLLIAVLLLAAYVRAIRARRRERGQVIDGRGWSRFLLMGPPQPRGQAALIDDSVQIGEDLVDGDVTYRVADIEVLAQGRPRRAWLANITDRERAKIEAEFRERLTDQLEPILHELVIEAVRPIYDRPATPDIPAIATYWAAQRIGEEASRLVWTTYQVSGPADLPTDLLPVVSFRRDGARDAVTWDVRPLARWMASRAPVGADNYG